MNRVRRRQIVREDDDVVRDLGNVVVCDSLQIHEHALRDVLDVRDPLAEVVVIERREARLELFLDFGERPLRVDLLLLDLLHHLVLERGVADDHGVRVEDRGVLVAHRAADLLLQLQQLVAGLLERLHEAGDLAVDLLVADRNAVHRGDALLDDHRAADGDPRRHADSLVGADVRARFGGSDGHVATILPTPLRRTSPR